MINRRQLLKGSLALSSGLFVPSLLAGAEKAKTLVVVFLRGAVDGLSIAIPHGDSHYFDLRPDISIRPSRPGKQDGGLFLNDQFSLHPAMRPLHNMFLDNQLSVIPACGSPHNTRSHFDAQDYMESGVSGDKTVRDGWMNRIQARLQRESEFDTIAMTPTLPRVMRGENSTLNIPNLNRFEIGFADSKGNIRNDASAENLVRSLYADSELSSTVSYSFSAMNRLKKRRFKSSETNYPDGALAIQLSQLAQLIKSDLGVQLAFTELGGWDSHANQGGATGQVAGNLYQLSYSLDAFFKDLGQRGEEVICLTMSEFGRTVRQNGNRGTDHGHGTTFLAVGGRQKGGKVVGTLPELAEDNLFEGRDVPVTTDYRNVLAELLLNHMDIDNIENVFPGFAPEPENLPGLFG